MTVYARSDSMSVAISPNHGGCGEVHSRPVRDGAPDKLWAMTCGGGCEDVLRNDPHWAGHPDDIPETPDEKMRRESDQRAGKKQRENSTHDAIQELSKLGDLPKAIEQLAQIIISGKLQGQDGPSTEPCSNGHTVPVGVKSCPECGTSMVVSEGDEGKTVPAAKSAPAKKAPVRKPPASS